MNRRNRAVHVFVHVCCSFAFLHFELRRLAGRRVRNVRVQVFYIAVDKLLGETRKLICPGLNSFLSLLVSLGPILVVGFGNVDDLHLDWLALL